MDSLYASRSRTRSAARHTMRASGLFLLVAGVLALLAPTCFAARPELTLGFGRPPVLVSGDPLGGEGYTMEFEGGSGVGGGMPAGPGGAVVKPAPGSKVEPATPKQDLALSRWDRVRRGAFGSSPFAMHFLRWVSIIGTGRF